MQLTDVFEKYSSRLPVHVRKLLEACLDAISYVVNRCAEENKQICFRLADVHEYLEVLTLPSVR